MTDTIDIMTMIMAIVCTVIMIIATMMTALITATMTGDIMMTAMTEVIKMTGDVETIATIVMTAEAMIGGQKASRTIRVGMITKVTEVSAIEATSKEISDWDLAKSVK